MHAASRARYTFCRATIHTLILLLCGQDAYPIPPNRPPVLPHEEIKKETLKKIRSVTVKGNKHIKTEVILKKLPYHKDGLFDPKRSGDAIKAIYALGYFNQVKLEVDDLGLGLVDVFLIVEEKKLIEKFAFVGNKAIKSKKFKDEFGLDKLDTIDQETVNRLVRAIEKLYKDTGYHFAKVEGALIENVHNADKVTAQFTIDEGIQSYVTRIFFDGNKAILSRNLANIILIKEDWVFSFLNDAGKYNEEMLSMDKHRIASYYLDNGFLNARVVDSTVKFTDDKKEIHITFFIQEGKQYTVRNVSAPGDDIYLETDLSPYIEIKSGDNYAHSKIAKSIENLKDLWGEKGYINADVYPQITPDDETDEVDITFHAERGNKVYVNRIDIVGNKVTRDKVIRRKIEIEEGDLITSTKLQRSQDGVEQLSFFDRGGVNWKLHRLSDDRSDLELNVREAKTGQLSMQASYGSIEHSNKRAFRIQGQVQQRNFMGKGWDIGLQAQLQPAVHGSKAYEGHFIDPNMFDSNVLGRVLGYHRKQQFDEWVNLTRTPTIAESGGEVGIGFFLPSIDKHLQASIDVGAQYLESFPTTARGPNSAALQGIVDDLFKTDHMQWFDISLFKDTRNHLVYPNRGYRVLLRNKTALPLFNDHYGYIKFEFEASYYTRLIGEDSLVLMLHAFAGAVHELGGDHIPYKELYHIGGQNTVRGFRFGSIGPAFNNIDPIGGRYALQFNSELIFPLVPDYRMKAHLFYDAGAGWSAPKSGAPSGIITRNNFNLRHAVGFGFNLVYPTPAKIDWGYKLDRNKKAGESAHEFHLAMNMAF